MIINNNNLTDLYPEFKNIKQRIVRLTVWNLDGTTDEMRFTYPAGFCWNGDDTNRAGQHLEEWCREMTRYYLKISHYQVDFGIVYQDGTERMECSWFEKKQVPLGKMYETGKCSNGKWMTPEKIKAKQQRDLHRYYDKNMSEGRQATTTRHNPDKPYVNSRFLKTKAYLN
jgi:hypothetical protein